MEQMQTQEQPTDVQPGVKRILVKFVGARTAPGGVPGSGTTTSDLLGQLKLDRRGFFISKGTADSTFGLDENLYPSLKDGIWFTSLRTWTRVINLFSGCPLWAPEEVLAMGLLSWLMKEKPRVPSVLPVPPVPPVKVALAPPRTLTHNTVKPDNTPLHLKRGGPGEATSIKAFTGPATAPGAARLSGAEIVSKFRSLSRRQNKSGSTPAGRAFMRKPG